MKIFSIKLMSPYDRLNNLLKIMRGNAPMVSHVKTPVSSVAPKTASIKK